MEDLAEQDRSQGQGEVAVGDGAAERSALGRLGVDVDPLVVAGGVGEQVDLRLVDEVPWKKKRAASAPTSSISSSSVMISPPRFERRTTSPPRLSVTSW